MLAALGDGAQPGDDAQRPLEPAALHLRRLNPESRTRSSRASQKRLTERCKRDAVFTLKEHRGCPLHKLCSTSSSRRPLLWERCKRDAVFTLGKEHRGCTAPTRAFSTSPCGGRFVGALQARRVLHIEKSIALHRSHKSFAAHRLPARPLWGALPARRRSSHWEKSIAVAPLPQELCSTSPLWRAAFVGALQARFRETCPLRTARSHAPSRRARGGAVRRVACASAR